MHYALGHIYIHALSVILINLWLQIMYVQSCTIKSSFCPFRQKKSIQHGPVEVKEDWNNLLEKFIVVTRTFSD